MGRIKDEVGNRYSRLTVIEHIGTDNHREAVFLCQCDCGNACLVTGGHLRDGHTKSCGCLNRDRTVERNRARRLPEGEAAFNKLLAKTKRATNKRGYAWALTREQFREFTKQPCHYCGAKPAQVQRGHSYNGSYTYNGLDRADNGQGYEISNVVPCCGTCNYMKRKMSAREFKEHITKIYKNYALQQEEQACQ